MKLWKVVATTLAACVAAGGAAGAAGKPAKVNLGSMTIGYTYYNRPGADVATHDADVKACVAVARDLSWAQEQPMSTYQSTGQGILGDALGNAMNHDVALHGHYGAVGAGVENCMVVRGWRVVMVPENEGIALSKLGQAALAAKLAPWIGSATPHGKVVRTFGNDAAFGSNQRLVNWPKSLDAYELSLTAATNQALTDFRPQELGGSGGSGGGAYLWQAPTPRLLEPGQIAAALQTGGVIIVSTTGFSGKGGPSLVMALSGHIEVGDGRGSFAIDARLMRKRAPFAAIAVLPGQWRIAGFGMLNFCLGAPSFEVKAGEVIYAGAFDFAAADLGPSLALDGAKGWLGAGSAAEALRPASYSNGSTDSCGGYGVYALEIKGAPYADGYHWGGAMPPVAP
ncbi:MAG: hypothetical protein JWP35_2319 [Caulobacter sp.]|nr:hypothetical protein [Caulobacter sp.]